jgi:hypothetical protein
MSLSDHDDYSAFSEVPSGAEEICQRWSDHYTAEAEDSDGESGSSFVGHGDASFAGQGFVLYIHLDDEDDTDEESVIDPLMPTLAHGYNSDDTATTVSTACDEDMVKYRLLYDCNQFRLWYEGNPSWIVNGPSPNRYQYGCAVDWLSDEDSDEGSIAYPDDLMQALDDDSSWDVSELETVD